MKRFTTIALAGAALLVAACTETPAPTGADGADIGAEGLSEVLGDGVTEPDAEAEVLDVRLETETSLPDADAGPPDVPSTGCVGGCEEGETCVSGNCVAACGGVAVSELAAGLAPGIDVLDNICVDTADVWAWQVGTDGSLYEVRAVPNGNATAMTLFGWSWWEGAESAAAGEVLDSASASGSVELWEVFPGRFLDLTEGVLLWGYAAGATGGEVRRVPLDGTDKLQVPAPGVYSAAQFSQLLLTTSNGIQATQSGPGAYYYHLVHGLGAPIMSGVGTAVGEIQVHKNEVILVSGYSNAWPDCGGLEPLEPQVGQRTYALSIPLLAALFSNQELPVDMLCEAEVVDLPADFTVLADGRIATASKDASFNVTGLSVNYWTMSTEAKFLKGVSLPITVGDTFSEVRADPHSTKLLLRHANGYLVVDGPQTQDPVVPETPVEPEPGPETAPEQAGDHADASSGEGIVDGGAADAANPGPQQ